MNSTATALVIGLAWSLPVIHFWVRQATNPIYWEEGAILLCAAVFATCFFPPSYAYVIQFVSPGIVYSVTTSVLVILAFLFSRYLKLYSAETMASVPKLDVIRHRLTVSGISVLVVVNLGLFLFGDVVEQQTLRPLSVEVRNPFILVTQLLLYVYFIAVLWIGLNYPLLYLLRVHANDRAFYTQGRPLRFNISILLHSAMSVNLLALLVAAIASFMMPTWTQGDEVVSLVSTWCSPIIIVLSLLTRTPQRILAGVYAWYLCFRLEPLHARMQRLHPENALHIDRPSLLYAAQHVEDAKTAIQRMMADITDARLMLYYNAPQCGTGEGSIPLKTLAPEELRHLAGEEGAFLAVLDRNKENLPCLPSAVRSVDCQSLFYYRMLARAVTRHACPRRG